MVFGVFGVFIILILSTAYILFSTIKMQEIADNSFQSERFIKSLQEALLDYQKPLLRYLSTRSSDALAEHLVISQRLRNTLPSRPELPRSPTELREREVYSLIRSYLDVADIAVEQKRGRNISGYAGLYDEMTDLLDYINAEIASISTERFRDQLDAYSSFTVSSRELLVWNLLLIVFVSLFAMMLLLRSVEKVTGPMTLLSAMATELSSGNFGIEDIGMSSVYEIDHVVDAFNRMKTEMRRYIEEIRHQENIKQEYMQARVRNFRMEALVRRMEIYTLQAQMNPHFLFNTLNTGMQLAIVEGADRTVEFMDQLSRLLRHNVGNKDSIVPLRHEIEGLRYYFYILKVRFPKNLDLTLDCPEELLDQCRVPGSILQPLVENCVVHAFKDKSDRCSLAVRAVRRDRYLTLSVRDNGCGMSADRVVRLLNPSPADDASARVMGLENVIHRILFYYPDDPEAIKIDTVRGEGTSIEIRVDMEREPCIEY
jgi:two-component system, sensor histidine kinase YesM